MNEVLARQTLETAKKREIRGAGAKTDVMLAQISLAKAELEHVRATGLHDKALIALVVALGLQAQDVHARSLVLARDYEEQDAGLNGELAQWMQLAHHHHPAVLAARAQLESVKARLAVTRSEGLPSLDFTLSQYVNGRPNQGLTTSQTTESVVGFTLNVPLLEGFGRTYKVRGAMAQIEVREAEVSDTENQVLGDVAKAHTEALAALRNLEASKRLLDAAQETLENVQRKYDRGVADILEMLSVQSALADAGQERVRALSEWRSARLRLLANAGTVGMKDIRKSQ
jgi:outer membrane protein